MDVDVDDEFCNVDGNGDGAVENILVNGIPIAKKLCARVNI